MEIKGKIEKILKPEHGTTKSGNEWTKQSIVLNNGDKYNPNVCITFFGDKCDLLQGLKVNNDVVVSVNVSSREFGGKYYHNIDGWKIESANDNDLPFS